LAKLSAARSSTGQDDIAQVDLHHRDKTTYSHLNEPAGAVRLRDQWLWDTSARLMGHAGGGEWLRPTQLQAPVRGQKNFIRYRLLAIDGN
jgi:hypothetical protein